MAPHGFLRRRVRCGVGLIARAHNFRALGSGVLHAVALDRVGVPSVALPPVPGLRQSATPLPRSRSDPVERGTPRQAVWPYRLVSAEGGAGCEPVKLFLLVG